MQDLLIHCLRGLAPAALKARVEGIDTHTADVFICELLFATMTSINFNAQRFTGYIQGAIALRIEDALNQ